MILDTFSFRLNLKLILLNEVFNINKNGWVNKQIERTKNQIWEFKTRPGLKIDLGMCYENESQILEYYGSDERQLPILNKLLLIKSSFDESIFDDPNLGRIFVEEPSNPKKIFQFLIKVIFSIYKTSARSS